MLKPLHNRNLKIIMTVIFSVLLFGLYFFLAIHGSGNYRGLYYACVLLCLFWALLLIQPHRKKICLILALACAAGADYFLILRYSVSHHPTDQLWGMVVFCFLQFCLAVYTWFTTQNRKYKIITVSIRAGITLLSIMILPCLQLNLVAVLAVIYFSNLLITVVVLACQIKAQALMLVAMICLLICDFFIGMNNGGSEFFQLQNTTWLTAYDFSFIFYIPSLYLLALASVWTRPISRSHNQAKPNTIPEH